jgi:hypothetical protein
MLAPFCLPLSFTDSTKNGRQTFWGEDFPDKTAEVISLVFATPKKENVIYTGGRRVLRRSYPQKRNPNHLVIEESQLCLSVFT